MRVPLDGIGSQGLNGDTPSFAVEHTFFTDGNNMRSFDGSLQGVPLFADDTVFTWSNADATADGIYSATQVTPTGSDFYNILSVMDDGGTTYVQVINENDPAAVATVDLPAGEPVVFNEEYGLDLFVFNEVTVLNAGTHRPLYFAQGIETQGDFQVIPNWFTTTGNITPIYARKMSPFQGRLVAMNFTGGNRGSATLAFSSPITDLDSLLAVEWVQASTNTAGDDIVADTPGPNIDGGPLGNFFVAYKTDSVISYSSIPQSPFFIPKLIFSDDGILSSRCFVDIGDSKHFVVGNRGAYVHDGSTTKQNVSRGRVEASLIAELDFNKKDRAFVFNHAEDKEVWVCFASINQTANGCDRAYVYNYMLDAWYKRDINNLTDIISTEINGQVQIFGTSRDSAVLQRLTDDHVADGFVEFARQDAGDATITKSISAIYPLSDGNIRIGLKHLNDLGDLPTFPDSDLKLFNPISQWKTDWRVKGRYFTFYFRMDGTTNPRISGVHLEAEPRGRR